MLDMWEGEMQIGGMPRQRRLNASVALVNRMARLEEMMELVAWEKLSVFTPTSPSRRVSIECHQTQTEYRLV
jgi:hypothetical protein